MWIFWLIVILFLFVVAYQLLPKVQIYIDEKWERIALIDFHDTVNFTIPEKYQSEEGPLPPDAYGGEKWGSPSQDGPCKILAGKCWWKDGSLMCSPEDQENKKEA